ncbi:copper chaperone PCu(A)C [Marinobacter sp.]|uniref:copper chaperone PCu(A)C n=1 Tax=Marinobacter sp. TaxID=50741 RepID=UPI0035690DE8
MNRFNVFTTALLLSCTTLATPPVLASSHQSHNHEHGRVQIDNPWSRPTPPGTPMGVGYLNITNNGGQDVTLVGAESPRAGHVSIHETSMHDGVMRMQPLQDGLAIPAGKTVELKPRSYHLMLEQLPKPLLEGEMIPVRLDFEGAEDMDIELMVQPLDGMPMDHSKMDHSDMDHSDMDH